MLKKLKLALTARKGSQNYRYHNNIFKELFSEDGKLHFLPCRIAFPGLPCPCGKAFVALERTAVGNHHKAFLRGKMIAHGLFQHLFAQGHRNTLAFHQQHRLVPFVPDPQIGSEGIAIDFQAGFHRNITGRHMATFPKKFNNKLAHTFFWRQNHIFFTNRIVNFFPSVFLNDTHTCKNNQNYVTLQVMKRIIRLLFFIGLLVCCGLSHAQEPFSSRASSFRFDPARKSNYFLKENELRLNIYGKDAQSTGKFVVPTTALYRYVYTDTASVLGEIKPIIPALPADFQYITNICLKAKLDCKINYKMWKASTFGTLFFTIVNPIASLSVAVPASLTPPRIENLGLSDVDMLQDELYFGTYRREAKRLKSKRIWTAYGIGFGIHVGILFGIISAVTN